SNIKEAGLKASRWMIDMQGPDGHWTRGNSDKANPQMTLYNVKAAWGLCGFGQAADFEPAVSAALRNAEYCVSRQLANGWFHDCCLEDATQPLLHTMAYAMQGLVGIGRLTGREEFIAATRRTADSLIRLMDAGGFIPGRIDSSFRGTV